MGRIDSIQKSPNDISAVLLFWGGLFILLAFLLIAIVTHIGPNPNSTYPMQDPMDSPIDRPREIPNNPPNPEMWQKP